MEANRNIEQEVQIVQEMFPDSDRLIIIDLLHECRSCDDAIERILSGDVSIQWKKSKSEPKPAQQNNQQSFPKNTANGQQKKGNGYSRSKFYQQNANNQHSYEQNKNPKFQRNSQYNIYELPKQNNFQNKNRNNHIKQPHQDAQNMIIQNQSVFQINSSSNNVLQQPKFEVFSSVLNLSQDEMAPTNDSIPSDNFISNDFTPSSSPVYEFDSVINKENKVRLTLPKDLENIKPDLNKFGSFAGPIPITHSPSSSSTSSSTKITISQEENRFESFSSIITKDVPTQLNTEDQNPTHSSQHIQYQNAHFPGMYPYQTFNGYNPQNHQYTQQFYQFNNQIPQYMQVDPKFMQPQHNMMSQYYSYMPQNTNSYMGSQTTNS